ncbi:MAG: hypothetical protein E6I37_13390 [Chloroflexi bacterium]|nr:MAG: hypothetical protein E6I37_13390 [Chloroflexota bacterium]
MDLRVKMARWGLRGFWLLAGVAASVMVGAFIFPKQFDIFLDISVGLWIAAMLCMAIMCVRFVQFLLARHRFYRQLSHQYGDSFAKDVRRTENPPWWNRMSRLQRTLYLLGALALGLLAAVARH